MDIFFGNGRSLEAFYSEVSGGRFTYVPANETSGGRNNGVISVTLPFPHPGGCDKSTTVKGTDGKTYKFPTIAALAEYAMRYADDFIDYSQYDADGDGYVTSHELAILCIVSGIEQSVGKPTSDDAVWAHSWQLNDGDQFTVYNSDDGVAVYKYTMMGENLNFQNPEQAISVQFGAAAHELGHDLGLPDLYNTLSGSGKQTKRNVAAESLMADGSWGAVSLDEAGGSCPTHLDAWCKAQLGFCDEITAENGNTYSLYPASDGERFSVLKIPTSDASVYYLVENRQLAGFDEGMMRNIEYGTMEGDGGLVVWRIDDALIRANHEDNTINAYRTSGDYGIMPVALDAEGLCIFRSGNGVVFDEDGIRIAAQGKNGYIDVQVENKNDVPVTTVETTEPPETTETTETPETTETTETTSAAGSLLYTATLSEGEDGAYEVTLYGHDMPDDDGTFAVTDESGSLLYDTWTTGVLSGGSSQKTGSITLPADTAGTFYVYCWIETLNEQPVSAMAKLDAKGRVTEGAYDKDGAAPLGFRLFAAKGNADNEYILTMLGHSLPADDAGTSVIYLSDPDDMSTYKLVSEPWAFVSLTGDETKKQGTIKLPKKAGGYCIYAGISDVNNTMVFAFLVADGKGVVTQGLVDPPSEDGTTEATPTANPVPTASPAATPTPTPGATTTPTPTPAATPAATGAPAPTPTTSGNNYTLFGGTVPAGLDGGGTGEMVETIALWPYVVGGVAIIAAIAIIIVRARRKTK